MPRPVRDALLAHARAEAPNECCGLLVGRGTSVEASAPVRNADPNPSVRYLIDPAGHIALNRRLRGTGQSIVGCYHSHPHSAPRPSASDVAGAYYSEFVWVIVSLGPQARARLRAWRIVDGRVHAVRLVLAGAR